VINQTDTEVTLKGEQIFGITGITTISLEKFNENYEVVK
jgi:hypothetical protein